MKRLICLLLFLILGSFATAQGGIPLIGPLVATTPALQDRIIIYDLGSNTERELSLGTGIHTVWGFSPDGCKLLYTLTDGLGLARLYTADLDGSNQRDLVQYDELLPNQWGIWEPQWSPDNSKIAFKILRDGFEGSLERVYHVAWVTPDGGEPTFYSRTGREHTPQWSPDGAWLAYVSYEERVAGADPYSTAEPTQEPIQGQVTQPATMLNEADIWVVSNDGETKYQLTGFRTGNVSMPRWSPDGELLSFVHSPEPNNDTQWIIANQQGAIPTQLTFFWNLALDTTWLPDSTGIVAVLRDFRDISENHLWRLPLVGNADTDAALYLDNPALGFVDYPRFSPDGSMLAFRSNYGLAVISTSDKTPILVDDVNAGNMPPVWSPVVFQGESQCQR